MSITGEIKFKELPPGSNRGVHARVAAQLRARPGEWACIGEYKSQSGAASIASGIRRATPSAYSPAGAFEATTRGRELWVRHVPLAVSA